MELAQQRLIKDEILLTEELVRRRGGDPLSSFDLFSPQTEFVDAVLKGLFSDNYYIGANRSGKSDAGAFVGSHLARFGHEDAYYIKGKGSNIAVKDRATSGWVSAIDFPTGRDTIQPKYFDNGFMPPGSTHEPFIPAREIKEWRVSDQILKLKNGSIIGFKSSDSGRLKYQGAEKDWVHFDEEHPEAIVDEVAIRVGQRPLVTFTTCTLLPPEGVVGGITWLYNDVVKPWKDGKRPDIGLFNASIYDNPHIPITEIERLEARYPEGSVQRRIRLNGELIGGLSGSRVYSGFDPKLNSRDQHEIVLRRPLCWVWDFNVEPMISIIGQREKDIFRVFRELHMDEGNISEMCDYFKQVHPKHLAEVWLYGDATGKERTAQTKMSSYNIILNNMKDYPAPLKMKVPEKNPGVTDRINAVNRACRTENGEVVLEIDPSCVELITDLEQVMADGRGGIKKTFNKKDPYYKRTHTSDALGYWIHFEAPIKSFSEHISRKVSIKRPRYQK